MMNRVYDGYSKKLVFEGTDAECEKWILDQAEAYDGRKFYRTWRSVDGDVYWDVGRVYIYNPR